MAVLEKKKAAVPGRRRGLPPNCRNPGRRRRVRAMSVRSCDPECYPTAREEDCREGLTRAPREEEKGARSVTGFGQLPDRKRE
jgi:hypothetical protein